jgi:hypothetical protein
MSGVTTKGRWPSEADLQTGRAGIQREGGTDGWRVAQLTDGRVFQRLQHGDGIWGPWLFMGRKWPARALRQEVGV